MMSPLVVVVCVFSEAFLDEPPGEAPFIIVANAPHDVKCVFLDIRQSTHRFLY